MTSVCRHKNGRGNVLKLLNCRLFSTGPPLFCIGRVEQPHTCKYKIVHMQNATAHIQLHTTMVWFHQRWHNPLLLDLVFTCSRRYLCCTIGNFWLIGEAHLDIVEWESYEIEVRWTRDALFFIWQNSGRTERFTMVHQITDIRTAAATELKLLSADSRPKGHAKAQWVGLKVSMLLMWRPSLWKAWAFVVASELWNDWSIYGRCIKFSTNVTSESRVCRVSLLFLCIMEALIIELFLFTSKLPNSGLLLLFETGSAKTTRGDI